jgi:hypothetical protein
MIAGIPYNRVHQLEFAPGEVRFDVTYQSTRKLWKDKQTEKGNDVAASYDSIVERGRKMLPALLAADSEISGNNDFVNLKDVKLEKERVEVEEMLESKARDRRLAQAEADRILSERRQLLVMNETMESGSVSPALLTFGGIATTSAALIAATQNTVQASDSKVVALVNATEQLLIDANGQSTTSIKINDADVGTSSSPLYTRERVNGDYNASLRIMTTLPGLDPRVAAEKAMEEYMQRDDGGEDWIRVMSEIILEPDDETDNVQENAAWNNISSFQ